MAEERKKEFATHIEYRAVFSYPPSYLGPTEDDYSQPVIDPALLPTHAPRSEENHGRVSGMQARVVTEWFDPREEGFSG